MNVLLLNKSWKNIVEKGEIAHDEQFLIFPEYFQKSSAVEASESFCMWEKVFELQTFDCEYWKESFFNI